MSEALIPTTGELVRLDRPDECADALETLRVLEAQIREAKRTLTNALADEAARQGTKTLRLPNGRTVTIGGGERRTIDPDVLRRALQDAGAPDDMIEEIIVQTVTEKVDARRADRAARANPAYAEAIDRATIREEAAWTASVR